MKEILLTQGQVALVDDEDYERVSKYKWCMCGRYAGRKLPRVKGQPRRSELLHRAIMGAEKGQEIDHINRNRLDCRRSNLRFCTRPQNLANSDKGRRYSRFKNVHLDKRNGRWRVTIRINRSEERR